MMKRLLVSLIRAMISGLAGFGVACGATHAFHNPIIGLVLGAAVTGANLALLRWSAVTRFEPPTGSAMQNGKHPIPPKPRDTTEDAIKDQAAGNEAQSLNAPSQADENRFRIDRKTGWREGI